MLMNYGYNNMYNYMDIVKISLIMYLKPTVNQSQLINYFRLIYHQNIHIKIIIILKLYTI